MSSGFLAFNQARDISILAPANQDARNGRIAFAAVSLACVCLIAVLFGMRTRNLHLNNLKDINAIRVIVLLTYITATILILCLGITSAVSPPDQLTCRAWIYLCLVFYVLTKIEMYLFLVERAHAIRTPRRRRLHDWIWVTGVAIIAMGFGAVAVDAYIYPNHELRDGQCHIGIPQKVAIPLVTYDVCINIAFTALFVHFLKPTLKFRLNMFQEAKHPPEPVTPLPRHISRTVDITTTTEHWSNFSTDGKEASASSLSTHSHPSTMVGWVQPSTRFQERHNRRMDLLLKKTLFGSFLVLIPTVVNMVLLMIVHGTEQDWLCSALCSLDVTLQVCVMHWLTCDPLDVETPPRGSMPVSTSSSAMTGHGSIHELQQV